MTYVPPPARPDGTDWHGEDPDHILGPWYLWVLLILIIGLAVFVLPAYYGWYPSLR